MRIIYENDDGVPIVSEKIYLPMNKYLHIAMGEKVLYESPKDHIKLFESKRTFEDKHLAKQHRIEFNNEGGIKVNVWLNIKNALKRIFRIK